MIIRARFKNVFYRAKKEWGIALALMLFFSSSSFAQLRLGATAPRSVDINESYFQVKYSIATALASDINYPSFSGFEVLAGPSVSTRSSYSSNGSHSSHSSSTTFTFTLAPTKKGRFVIPAASVKVGGRVYKSNSLTINVGGRGNRNQNSVNQRSHSSNSGEELRDAGSRVSSSDLYLSATASRKKVYEQQGVLLTYKFFERPGVGLNSVGISSKPDFKGMVSQDLPVKNISATTARVRGHLYRSGVVQQYLVYPQQTGNLRIPSLTFDCVVVQQEKSLDLIDAFFNGGGNVGMNLKRTAPGLNIEVMPLPTPKPAGFSGGVGHFSIKGEMVNDNPETNQVLTYRITVSGNGNLKLITAPQLALPTDFDKFTPKTTDNSSVGVNGVSGNMVFDYTFVPRNKGKYTIPSVSFIYFDPESARYITIKTTPLTIDIKQGKASDKDLQDNIKLLNSDIRDIHPDASPQLTNSGNIVWWGRWQYWLIHALLFTLFIFGCLLYRKYRQRMSDTVGRLSSKAGNMALKRMKMAQPLLKEGKTREFYTQLAKLLSLYIAERFGINAADINAETLKSVLEGKGISGQLSTQYVQIMADCSRAAYSPLKEEEDETLQTRVANTIADIEMALKSKSTKH